MLEILVSPFVLTAVAIIAAPLHFLMRQDKNKRLASYRGAHVFLTGGSDGLGLEICRALIGEGVRTVSLFARNEKKLETARARLLQLAKEPWGDALCLV